jgi:hypothetical protein
VASTESHIIETLFRVADKEGNDVDFILNPAQRRLDEELTGRDLVPKARQEGVSTYVLARFLAACLAYNNMRAVVISHETESTQRLLGRVKYFIDNIRGPKPVMKHASENKLSFPKKNSMFYIGTAGSRKFGRGDTISHLHCSEYAYWPNARSLMVGLLQAVPKSGEIIVESTGNGFNDYHKRCMKAEAGQSVWTNHFLPWNTFPEYTLDGMTPKEEATFLDNLNEDWEEPALLLRGLTPGQLAWRRMKLDELDYDIQAFKQEYPMSLDECFQMSSESIFHKVRYVPTDDWKLIARGMWVLEGHPNPACHYTQGVDVGAGVGKDSSVSEVFCLETSEQVGEYINNRVDPEAFAGKVADIGVTFNDAYTVVENNNHGILTLAALANLYPSNLIHYDPAAAVSTEEKQIMSLGYRTTPRSKPLMVGRLRTLLANDWVIHSPILKNQLSTFIEHESGRLAAQDGCDDDTVIASACAGVGLNPAALAARPRVVRPALVNDPFLLDTIIKEMRSTGEGFPISPQHEGEWN